MIETIFYHVDNFCKKILPKSENRWLQDKKRNRKGRKMIMSKEEVITILINFHYSHFKNFKIYYSALRDSEHYYFRKYVSYNRMIELKNNYNDVVAAFIKYNTLNQCTGVSYIDSTPLKVCRNERRFQHKVFSNIAKSSKTSMGWFFGLKLHIVINERGELLSFVLSQANIVDNNASVVGALTKNIVGKLFGDRGYISQKLTNNLREKGISLITRIKKGMKNQLMLRRDKFLLRYRNIIESTFGILKQRMDLEHTRYRNPNSLISNVLISLAAYVFYPHKPAVRHRRRLSNQLL